MKSSTLLVELSVMPIGRNPHTSPLLANILDDIAKSGLPYQLTPTGTCIQGTWDEVMPVIKACHKRAAAWAPHVVTMIRIEQDAHTMEPLSRYPESVDEKTDRPLRMVPLPRTSKVRRSPRFHANDGSGYSL